MKKAIHWLVHKLGMNMGKVETWWQPKCLRWQTHVAFMNVLYRTAAVAAEPNHQLLVYPPRFDVAHVHA